MQVLIVCPTCARQSEIAEDKLPPGRLMTTCNRCKNKFPLDKEAGLNCQRVEKGAAKVWKIDIPACKGMTYQLEDVAKLIRSGMVTRETQLFPDKGGAVSAGEVHHLAHAFEQWDQRNRER